GMLMTLTTGPSLDALSLDLPDVERRAAIPLGFRGGGAAIGIKASGRPDLAMIATTLDADGRPLTASAAATFTPNAFAAAPVTLSRAHLCANAPAEGERG